MGRAGVGIRINRDGCDAQSAEGLIDADRDFATVGYQHFGKHVTIDGRRSERERWSIAPYILKTPRFWSGKGALMDAAIPRPTTSRVSTGSMMPSSQRRAVL